MEIARDDVLTRLRSSVGDLLASVEDATGLQVRFTRLPSTSHVVAKYAFNPHENSATVGLGTHWEDVDVAHELLHMQLELVESFKVLAWRRNVTPIHALDAAMRTLRMVPTMKLCIRGLYQLASTWTARC